MSTARRSISTTGSLVAALVLVVSGCAALAAGPDTTTADTVGNVGQLPTFSETSTESTVATEESETTAAPEETTASSVPDDVLGPLGERVMGNRLLMIGDSLTASISERYGGEACDALVPLGWEVEVDAETGRFIDFGARVLDKRLDAGWDAAVLFLGNNYGEDRGVYQLALHSLLTRLAPRPTVLITTSLFRPEQSDVNAAILEEAGLFDNVSVIDWQTISEDPALTGGDNLHLTDAGRARLGYQLAAAAGPAPKQPGKCLPTNYHDDSAGSPNGPAGNTTATKTTTKPNTTKPTTTTAKPTDPTGPTTPVTSPPVSAPSTPATTPTTPASTNPPPTPPPVTDPPTTPATVPTTPPPTP